MPRVDQLAARERAMSMHLLHHELVHREVVFVDQTSLDKWGYVASPITLDLLGTDDSPAALGLDAAHLSHRGWSYAPHPIAMRYLEEAVTGRNRSELHRLEQNVISGNTVTHRPLPISHSYRSASSNRTAS